MTAFSQNLIVQEAFETAAQINKELKITEFNGAFWEKFNLLIIDFLHFFAKGMKSVEKMIHQKKNWDHQTFKMIKSRQTIALVICPIIILLFTITGSLSLVRIQIDRIFNCPVCKLSSSTFSCQTVNFLTNEIFIDFFM